MYRIWETQCSQQMWSQRVIVVVIAVVFVLVAQSCLTLVTPRPLNFPVCPYLTLNMWVGMAEVPTKHSVESQRFTKSATKSLGIWGSIKHHSWDYCMIADTMYYSDSTGACVWCKASWKAEVPHWRQDVLVTPRITTSTIAKSPLPSAWWCILTKHTPQWVLNMRTPRLPSTGPGTEHLWKKSFRFPGAQFLLLELSWGLPSAPFTSFIVQLPVPLPTPHWHPYPCTSSRGVCILPPPSPMANQWPLCKQ